MTKQRTGAMLGESRKVIAGAGWLYILGLAAGVLSISPAADSPDRLVRVSSAAGGVILAAFFHLLMAPIYVGVVIALYPVLKRHGRRLAMGFAATRMMAAVFVVMGVVVLLLMPALSREFAGAGARDAAALKAVGALLQSGRDLLNHVATVLSVCASALLLGLLLFRARLVPRWLSAWGIGGAALAMAASLLFFFGAVGVITPAYLILNVPMAAQEIVLAIWLIARGFAPPPAGTPAGKP